MSNKISRRSFVRVGGTGLLAASFIPAFLQTNPIKAMNPLPGLELSLEDFLTRFGVNETIIREVMAEALAKGGDYCDLFFEHTLLNYVGLEDDSVNRAYNNIDFGVGIRVLNGDQTGYSFTEEITPKAMKQAAATAANIARSSKSSAPQKFSLYDHPEYYKIKTDWEDVSVKQKVPILQQLNDEMKAIDKRVVKTTVTFMNSTTYKLIATSDGRITYDYQPMGLVSCSCIAEQNGQRESNGYSYAGRYGFDVLDKEQIKHIAKEAVTRTTLLFDAVKPEAGEMPVVLAAGQSGILLHEAIGHGMEADFNRKEVSIFSDKINKPVAKDFVTIVDDATKTNLRGSINVDDEGNDTENTVLVENGILKSYLHDRISSKYYKVKPTGNGRRESFRHMPLPRMRNTYMLNGPHTKDDIIASVKKGIYAESFTNGQVNIGGGDFTFYVQSGYLIENGKMTAPIKDVNIIGNGPKVLEKIEMVADDLQISMGGWTCGKSGQGVPVSIGLPTAKVSSITVGGVNQ